MGQGQSSGTQQSILGARLCRVQQRAIIVITSLRCLCLCNQCTYTDNSMDAVNLHLICVSVISGRIQIIAWMQSICI